MDELLKERLDELKGLAFKPLESAVDHKKRVLPKFKEFKTNLEKNTEDKQLSEQLKVIERKLI